MTVHACALRFDLHIAAAGSLKAKRGVVKHLVEAGRSRFAVAAAETGFHAQWKRTELGFVAVSGSVVHTEEILDSVERFVWSHPGVEVIESSRTWLEPE